MAWCAQSLFQPAWVSKGQQKACNGKKLDERGKKDGWEKGTIGEAEHRVSLKTAKKRVCQII